MPGMTFDSDGGYDDQDRAEVVDEDAYDTAEENNRMLTFEELPDVIDVTAADGDADEDEPLALDADEFDDEAFDDAAPDTEEDNELDYRAAADNDDDDFDLDDLDETDGNGFDADALDEADSIEGLELVADNEQVSGGEDDLTDFQSSDVSDEDLIAMDYAERGPDGVVRAKPEERTFSGAELADSAGEDDGAGRASSGDERAPSPRGPA